MSDGKGRRVLLLINSLEGGGAEKVMAQIAAGLTGMLPPGQVRLAMLDDLPAAWPLPEGVDLVRLDCRGSFRRSIRETRRLVAEWRPDVVLSFLTRANCAAILACRRAGATCVVSERVNTTTHLGAGPRGRVLRAVVARLYPRADAVVAVSRGVARELRRAYGVTEARLRVIPNPVETGVLEARAAEAPAIRLPDRFLVSVGRLVPNKGGEILLRAFAASGFPGALLMLGDGPERGRLMALARDLGISDRVHLPGYLQNPHAVVARAEAWVSASRSEGFPNAMVEAMALGLPVIATDCRSGPREILAPEGAAEAGLLVPVDDVAALSAAIDGLGDADRRRDLSGRARRRVQDFRPDAVIAAYAEVLGV
ncbi:glycosyltransferase [Histidinibacterium lentulum]|uniref:Glycosyltransferase n=1 Tax=Histidinibacterium lentulum TaxID=2480588 RepID=A0A3N2QS40_9RHOB|nr:glycosyltransferase [Histidinibacterium lentulum]ROT97994.1 glycosyltransferase [Histidinibacterium lentulum]